MHLFLFTVFVIKLNFLLLFTDANRQYKVVTKRFSDKPIISRKIGSDFYSNLYAGIYNDDNEYGLIVGTWNGTGYYLVNSRLFYFPNGTISALQTLNNMTLSFPKGTTNYNSGGNNFDSISFFNGSYYMLYDETDINEYPVLAWAKTDNPFDYNSWTRLGHIFPDSDKINTFKASFLWATQENDLPMHYLFWDDTQSISYMTSMDGLSWPSISTPFLYPRPLHFDSDSIYVGTNPLPLKTGDFLFLYSGVNDDDKTRTGWAILDAVNPSDVLQRGNDSIMSPELEWEQDIYLTSIIPDPYGCPSNIGDIIGPNFIPNAECFIGVYGIYEIGAVRVVASWIDDMPISSTPSSDACVDVDDTCWTMTSQCTLSAYIPIMCKYCQKTCNLCKNPKCNHSN
jgi:hypothetical protein